MKKIKDERIYQAIEYLAQGMHTYKKVAELCNISVDTLRDWRKDSEFQEEVRTRCRSELQESEGFLYTAALREIRRNGSYQHIKILLDRMARLEDIALGTKQELDVNFTWKARDEE